MRSRAVKWYLLFRIENGQQVYLYEPLRKKQVSGYLKYGWEVKPND